MNGSVLIFDEDVNTQIIAQTLLHLRGLNVHIVTDPTHAAEIVARGKVGVVMVDLNGVRTNGFEVLRGLHEIAQTLPTPPRLVAVTDLRDPRQKLFAQRLGAAAVLHKPLDPGQLISTIEALSADQNPRALVRGFLQRFYGRAPG